LRESVLDGETGLLVPHGDPQALAVAMSRLAGDRALVDRLGAAGRRFAERLSWERAAELTEAHVLTTVRGTHSGKE
jgi:glycosyltransferase involved in cell wall biosynthesis